MVQLQHEKLEDAQLTSNIIPYDNLSEILLDLDSRLSSTSNRLSSMEYSADDTDVRALAMSLKQIIKLFGGTVDDDYVMFKYSVDDVMTNSDLDFNCMVVGMSSACSAGLSVDWGDGNQAVGELYHKYPLSGEYDVKIYAKGITTHPYILESDKVYSSEAYGKYIVKYAGESAYQEFDSPDYIDMFRAEYVAFPNTIYSLPSGFYDCGSNLKHIDFGPCSKISCIPDDMFRYCSLTCLYLPDSVLSIGSRAFQYNYPLRQVRFPENPPEVGVSAFQFAFLDNPQIHGGYRLSDIIDVSSLYFHDSRYDDFDGNSGLLQAKSRRMALWPWHTHTWVDDDSDMDKNELCVGYKADNLSCTRRIIDYVRFDEYRVILRRTGKITNIQPANLSDIIDDQEKYERIFGYWSKKFSMLANISEISHKRIIWSDGKEKEIDYTFAPSDRKGQSAEEQFRNNPHNVNHDFPKYSFTANRKDMVLTKDWNQIRITYDIEYEKEFIGFEGSKFALRHIGEYSYDEHHHHHQVCDPYASGGCGERRIKPDSDYIIKRSQAVILNKNNWTPLLIEYREQLSDIVPIKSISRKWFFFKTEEIEYEHADIVKTYIIEDKDQQPDPTIISAALSYRIKETDYMANNELAGYHGLSR